MKLSVRDMARAAVIAAAYAALSLLSSFFGLAYGPVQLRLSEALTLLPKKYPSAIWGVFLGCLLTNILSPYGLLDMILGSAATLLAALLTARCRTNVGAAVPPIVCNALIIGALLAWQESGGSAAFTTLFAYHALSVGAGQAVACFLLGVPLMRLLERKK